jgi:hypothetical protein
MERIPQDLARRQKLRALSMEFWTLFGRFADILGIGSLLFSAYAAFRLWQQNRRLRELARIASPMENFAELVARHDGIKSSAPVALGLSLTSNAESIAPSIQHFLKTQGWSMPIEQLNLNGIIGVQGMEALITGLREKRRFIEAAGYTEVHLFFHGPVAAAAVAGSMLDNWIPVKLYHKPTPAPPQIYEYWMPLL